MNLYPPHLQRDIDPNVLEQNRKMAQRSVPERWTGQRSGIEIPRMQSTIELDGRRSPKTSSTPARKFADVTEYLMSKVLTPEKLRRPEQMVHVMNALGKGGEVLYILRPLIYGMWWWFWSRTKERG